MLPLYLVNEQAMHPSWANTVVALSRIHGPILGLLGGWVSDWLGPKRTMVVSLIFTGIATLLLHRFRLVDQRCGCSSAALGGLVFSGGIRRISADHRTQCSEPGGRLYCAVRVYGGRRRHSYIYRHDGEMPVCLRWRIHRYREPDCLRWYSRHAASPAAIGEKNGVNDVVLHTTAVL
jgi:hypothetical protein